MSSVSYFPPPILAVEIPKPDGRKRLLGMATVGDKVAQTVAKIYFGPIVESIFLEDSYGYRPNKSAHQTIAVTEERCRKFSHVLEFDIVGLFDNLPFDIIMKAVRYQTNIKWLILYIERWIKVPLTKEGRNNREKVVGSKSGRCYWPIASKFSYAFCF